MKNIRNKPTHEKDENNQDDQYQIPVLRAANFSMSPELMRRQKKEQLKKRYGIN